MCSRHSSDPAGYPPFRSDRSSTVLDQLRHIQRGPIIRAFFPPGVRGIGLRDGADQQPGVGVLRPLHDLLRITRLHNLATMQDDGNFVVYNGPNSNKKGGAIWSTTVRGPGEYRASVQDGGTFSIFTSSLP